MITLVKFINNKLESAPPNNKVITKTLGKTGVLSWEHIDPRDPIPKAEEFWYVEVVKEKGAGTPKGVFLLKPIQRVGGTTGEENKPDIIHMIPGTYVTERVDNTILLHPKILNHPESLGPNWICSLTMKRKLMDKHREGSDYKVNSIIVVFDRANSWPKEDVDVRPAEKSAERSEVGMTPT